MIILGDLACPTEEHVKELESFFTENADVFNGKGLILNFEGLLSAKNDLSVDKPVLSNHPGVIEILKTNSLKVASLANNHVLDLPDHFISTLESFSKSGILYLGASEHPIELCTPVLFDDEGTQVIMINYCWDFLLYSHQNPSDNVHISTIDEVKILQQVREIKSSYPSSHLLVYFHWGFDLENLPLPIHRKFSKELIDNGVSVVVGSHSHCVQGGEKYKNGYIIYDLGNFFIPAKTFVNGKLNYPGFTRMELGLEYNASTGQAVCHWFEYRPEDHINSIVYKGSEKFENSETLKRYSPYAQMSDHDYISYYKNNRRKKLLIPIFTDFKQVRVNKIKMAILKTRARIAHWLAVKKIIKWQH